MKIGFIGFGEVASTLSESLLDKGVEIYTCVEGRSSRTKQLAEKIGVNLCKTNMGIGEVSDILISSVNPSQAVNVAHEVGKHCKCVYVDMNNVSPSTVKLALGFIENGKIVDASIIGAIRKKGFEAHIIASGSYADYFAKLNDYGMDISVIGDEVGQASSIKILRSSYTKGVSALLFETLYSAYKIGIDDQLLKYISETECPDFSESAISRIISSAFHAKRRSQEMEEVLDVVSEHINPVINKGTAEFFKSLYEKIDQLEKRPEGYKEVFKIFEEA